MNNLKQSEVADLRARLTTAEQEREEWRVTAETLRDMENEAAKGLLRRVEALSEALRFYADPETYFAIGFLPDHPCGEFIEDFDETPHLGMKPGKRARAALACPPQPFDPETSPGMTDLMVSPEAIDEYLAACPPPEEEK